MSIILIGLCQWQRVENKRSNMIIETILHKYWWNFLLADTRSIDHWIMINFLQWLIETRFSERCHTHTQETNATEWVRRMLAVRLINKRNHWIRENERRARACNWQRSNIQHVLIQIEDQYWFEWCKQYYHWRLFWLLSATSSYNCCNLIEFLAAFRTFCWNVCMIFGIDLHPIDY